jgi:hypothetical protein
MKALVFLALATVLAVMATVLLAASIGRASHQDGSLGAAVAGLASATPGSTAHARHLYRVNVGR